jgi:drug/metabolite transporter (DMT)-like permease
LGVPGALAIASFYPAWTVIVGSVFGNAQTTLLQWVGLLVALCGIITVILFTPAQKSSARNGTLKGVLFAFSTSVLWGMNTFSVGQGGAGISPFAGNAVRMVLAMLICTILGLVFAKGRPLILPATVIYKNGWIFVLEAFGGSLLFMYGLANSAVVLGATLSALSPVVAVPISLLTKAEQFSLPRSLGVLLSAIGVCLILSSNPLQ